MARNESRNQSSRGDRNYSGSSHNTGSQRSGTSSNLHEAAEKMRSGNAEERSEGASELGKAGGHQSHKND